MTPKQLLKIGKEIFEQAEDIDCNGFFACPGNEGNRIYHMKTCRNCATVIELRRIARKLGYEK
jgi:hypothetical protein